ncbi:MAG: SMC-Scp complex subunit ScpB [Candidatus Omnitrophica bacterium]|nr:SMC-Scp complex subunit ScpB [Candidatus Omnitrophota bacterium]
MTDQSSIYVQGAVEALLFVSDKPVMIEEMKEVIGDIDGRALRQAIDDLKLKYESEKRGMVIVEIAGGYQMLSNPEYANAIRTFYRTQKKEKLSKPALESLAIIAYKQSVTRLEIELIRGVNSDGVVNHLLEKNLIKITGRKDVPGKPFIYGTTKEFLEYFGLRSLSDLPKIEEFASLEEKATENIQAFQGVTEEFKQQATEHSTLEKKDEETAVPDQTKGQNSEPSLPEENHNNTNAAPVVIEGGNDEHPQAS